MSTATPLPQVHHAKTATIITALVLVLHALVGMVLLHMPAVSLKPLTITPPLELAFVTPLTTISDPTDAAKSAKSSITDIQSTSVKPIHTANHKPHLTNPPSPAKTIPSPVNSKPRMASRQPAPTTAKTSVIEPKPIKPTTTDKAMADKPIVNKVAQSNSTSATPPIMTAKPIDNAPMEPAHKVAPAPDDERLAQQPTIAQVQAEQFEKSQTAHEQTVREQATHTRIAQAPWQQDKTEKAKAEPTKAAQHSPQQNKEPLIQTSASISLNAGDTKWQTKPNIMLTRSLSALGKRKHITNMTVRVSFSANGDITGVSMIQSSGNAQIDTYLQRQVMKGKLYPYTFDGHAVAGTFILPISINYLN